MNRVLIYLTILAVMPCVSHAQGLVYLSCNVSIPEGKPNRYLDFTLDEANGTVSFYVEEADAQNKVKAVFGPDTVKWTVGDDIVSATRTINRVTLAFTEEVTVVGKRRVESGNCSVVKEPERKF